MSYGLIPYRCDLDWVNGLYGNIGKSDLQQLKEAFSALLESLDNSFDEPVKAHHILEDYAAGTVNHPSFPHLYWYIFEGFCRLSGEMLPNGASYPGGTDIIDPLGNIQLYCLSHPALPMPDDFPAVYVCPRTRLDALLAELPGADVSEENRREFAQWAEMARAHNQDLVIFYY